MLSVYVLECILLNSIFILFDIMFFFTIVWNNEECIIFSVIDILCFEEDGSTFKKKETSHILLFSKFIFGQRYSFVG
jgi:hypothetical protein